MGVVSVIVEAEAGLKEEGTGGTVSNVYVRFSFVVASSLLPAVSWQATYTFFAPSAPRSESVQEVDCVPSPVQFVLSDIASYVSSVVEAKQSPFSSSENVIVGVLSVIVLAEAGLKEEGDGTVVSNV